MHGKLGHKQVLNPTTGKRPSYRFSYGRETYEGHTSSKGSHSESVIKEKYLFQQRLLGQPLEWTEEVAEISLDSLWAVATPPLPRSKRLRAGLAIGLHTKLVDLMDDYQRSGAPEVGLMPYRAPLVMWNVDAQYCILPRTLNMHALLALWGRLSGFFKSSESKERIGFKELAKNAGVTETSAKPHAFTHLALQMVKLHDRFAGLLHRMEKETKDNDFSS